VQSLVHLARQERLGPRHGLAQGVRPGGDRHVVQPLGELAPVGVTDVAGAVLTDGDQRQVPEGIGIHLVEAGADDAQVVDEPGLEEVQQPRDELALGEVPRGSEEHDGRGCGHGVSLSPGGRAPLPPGRSTDAGHPASGVR
jgi:hypothetical protein